jgi:hypothetical protein
MFRPSRGHLQADIGNILGSLQIMRGSGMSLLTGFVTVLVFTYNWNSRLKLKIKKYKIKIKLKFNQ